MRFSSVAFFLVSLLALEVSSRSILIERHLVAPTCKTTKIAYDGATCRSLAGQSGITVEQFKLYNPTITHCDRLSIGKPYCVQPFPDENSNPKQTPITAQPPNPLPPTSSPDPTVSPTQVTPVPPPGPTQPGALPTCARWTLVRPGDTCLSITSAFNHAFTHADLISWNPTIGVYCENIWANFYLCTAAATAVEDPDDGDDGGDGPPGPTQPGQPSNCNKWHLAQKGENCYSMVREYGMRLEEVLEWNPGFGGRCENVWVGWWACVGVGE